jgi:GntR family transcriptional regulator
MHPLTGDARLPRYQQLRDHMVDQIANNRWRPAKRSDRSSLATEFDMSVGTVRKAVDAGGRRRAGASAGPRHFIRRPQFQSSLFRFFRFEAANGERVVPKAASCPSSAGGAIGRGRAAGPGAEAEVIRIVRTRLLGAQPVLAEEIWLPRQTFQPLLDVELNSKGPLLYPIYEELCGQVVAYAEETLTAEAVDAVHGRLLQLPADSPVVVIERLARDYAGKPLEWRRSRGHAQHFRYRIDIR